MVMANGKRRVRCRSYHNRFRKFSGSRPLYHDATSRQLHLPINGSPFSLSLHPTAIPSSFPRHLTQDMTNINKRVPGLEQYISLNEPSIGATLPPVRLGPTH